MSKQRPYYIPEEYWIPDLNAYVLEIARKYLPLQEYGFRESYRDEYHRVILDSEWCRVRFYAKWEIDYHGQPPEYEALIFYGRLHAPNESVTMEWQGEKCKCWHGVPFYFYDYIDYAFPRAGRVLRGDIFMDFQKRVEEFPDSIHWKIALEAEKWKHYVPELFYLFDLRRPDLWENYRAWLKARYVAEGRSEAEDKRQGLIPYYRVC